MTDLEQEYQRFAECNAALEGLPEVGKEYLDNVFNLLTRYREALAKERERALEEAIRRMKEIQVRYEIDTDTIWIDVVIQELEKLKGTGHE